MPEVRAARPDERAALTAVFAAAFHGTATFRWLIEGDAARARLLPAFFDGTVRHVLSQPGAGLVASDGSGAPLVAGAAWLPPGRWKPPWWRTLQTAPALLRVADAATLREFGAKGPLLDRALAAAHPSGPHWYLAGIAVDPAAQGAGVGGALVRAGLERSRRDGVPAYLECVEALVPYYERFGFEVRHDIPIGGGAPDQVGMMAD